MRAVTQSSNIEAFGHENGTLTVRFKGGAVYDYENVPQEIHDAWVKDHEDGGSAGKFFHRHIKHYYTGKKRESE